MEDREAGAAEATAVSASCLGDVLSLGGLNERTVVSVDYLQVSGVSKLW